MDGWMDGWMDGRTEELKLTEHESIIGTFMEVQTKVNKNS